ncbi:porin [Ramlibacter sp. WS9]|uniref:porin n=1 Tax=Ramlibacter sp. WS9 TaxID=1882741 RepID=UPI001143D9C9|nr:porin [Ramlibacter sp. WS9]ROZ78121.1 porin [Ramlibacter sp. WS9]HSV36712.1 porin [Ramlibacter sp.]
MRRGIKGLVVAGAYGVATVAFGQSTVTLFGVADVSVQNLRADGVGSATRVASGGNNTSRIGFRGQEDLGGGMGAGFWLEATLSVDNGQGAATNVNNQANGGSSAPAGTQGLTFDRRATVSLMGTWGEVRLGRDYVPSYWNVTRSDPFSATGVASIRSLVGTGAVNAVTFVRASNSVAYHLPADLGGFYGQVNYMLGENASNVTNRKDGTYIGARVGFAKGPIDGAIATSRTEYLAGDFSNSNLYGAYDFKVAKVSALWNQSTVKSAVPLKQRDYQVGLVVPVGAGELKASFARARITTSATDDGATLLGLGYVHNLSKRSAAYVHYARVSNRGAARFSNGSGAPSPGGDTTAYEVGLRHSF